MKTLKIIAAYRFTIFVFLLIVFRPHVLGFIRREVLHDPKVCTSKIHPIHMASVMTDEPGEDYGDDGCSNDDESCSSSTDNSYYEDDTADDGCSDDGDSCDDTSSDDTSTDYSSDDGCSGEDDSCDDTSNDDPYNGNQDTYSDDGCACQGETVVSSGESLPPDFYNSTLQCKLTFNASTAMWTLHIENASGDTLTILTRNTKFGGQSSSFSWDGYYGQNQFVVEGTYYAVLSTNNSPRITDRKSFYYTGQHGFQVNQTLSNVLEFIH